MSPTDPKKPAPKSKPLTEVVKDLRKDIEEMFQENDPVKLAEQARKEAERDAAMAREIVKMRQEGKLPSMKGKKVPPKSRPISDPQVR